MCCGIACVRLRRIAHAEHFDAFLAFPGYASRFVPLLPYMYAGLDRLWATLDGQGTVAGDLHVDATPRGTGQETAVDLRVPR